MEHYEVLLEEPSMEAAMHHLLPKVLPPGVTFDLHVSFGKSNLLKNLPARLKGYASWLPANWRVVVIVDRDADDAHTLKSRLEDIAQAAGLGTRSNPNDGTFSLVNRIAIEELEAWFFGDWEAVRAAYPKVSVAVPRKAAYRDPDAIAGGTWEALERALRAGGYFSGGLRKIEAAGTIAAHMDPDKNRSKSFQVMLTAFV